MCWGCQWSGDVFKFVMDHYGLTFMEAVDRLEQDHGLDGLAARPVRRNKVERARRDRPAVSSAEFGHWLWRHARPDHDSVRIYLRARGVPDAMLGDDRLADIRFCSSGPIMAWREGSRPSSVDQGPAMVALVRRPWPGRPGEWMPIGVHVTFLSPDLTAKAERKWPDGSSMPARKMLGAALGGCVLLGRYLPDAPLFDGEGIETVLSGMAMAGEAAVAGVGIAALSLNNLQGHARMIRDALPLYDVEPDPDRAPALTFDHRGPVTVLVDADMKALRGWRRGSSIQLPRVIERHGGPIIERVITTAERASICAALAVRAWRARGCRATAIRPRMGMDFNDQVREGV